MKGKTKQQKGITLIALIITIVILLVLAAVAIQAIKKDGLIGKAEDAATAYNGRVDQENGDLVTFKEYLNNFMVEGSIGGGDGTTGGGGSTTSSTFSRLKNYKNQYIGHSAMQDYMPANTIEALYTSILLDVKAIEFDVRFTSDGVPVLLHDSAVSSVTTGTGNIEDLTLEQVKALNIGTSSMNTSEKFNHSAKIPTLEEYIIICKQYNVFPMVEIKGEGMKISEQEAVDKVMVILNKYNMRENSAIFSFSASLLEYVKTIDENMCIFLCGDSSKPITDSTLEKFSNYNNVCIDLQSSWTSLYNAETVKKIQDMGMYVSSNSYTETAYNAAKSLGVDFFSINSRYDYNNISEKKFSATVTRSGELATIAEKEAFISTTWAVTGSSTNTERIYVNNDNVYRFWMNKFKSNVKYEVSSSADGIFKIEHYNKAGKPDWYIDCFEDDGTTKRAYTSIENGETIDVTITFFGQ